MSEQDTPFLLSKSESFDKEERELNPSGYVPTSVEDDLDNSDDSPAEFPSSTPKQTYSPSLISPYHYSSPRNSSLEHGNPP